MCYNIIPVRQELLFRVAVLVDDLHLLQDGRFAALCRPEEQKFHFLQAVNATLKLKLMMMVLELAPLLVRRQFLHARVESGHDYAHAAAADADDGDVFFRSSSVTE